MRYRTLGATGLRVSEIGFGTWGLGGAAKGAVAYGPTDDAQSIAALRAAFDRGITFFDTADLYGYGHSEEILAGAFSAMRERVVIALRGDEVYVHLDGEAYRLDYAHSLERFAGGGDFFHTGDHDAAHVVVDAVRLAKLWREVLHRHAQLVSCRAGLVVVVLCRVVFRHFGAFGGRFVPETLMPLILELEFAYAEARKDLAFQQEMES